MSTINVKVEGIEKTLASLKKWQIIKHQACADVLKKIGFKVEGDAKRNHVADGPMVQTARLVDSLTTNWSGSGMARGKVRSRADANDGVGEPQGPKGLVVVVGTNVKYAHIQELGTWSEEGEEGPKVGPSESLKKRRPSMPRPQGGFQFLTKAYLQHEGEVGTEIGKVMGKDERV